MNSSDAIAASPSTTTPVTRRLVLDEHAQRDEQLHAADTEHNPAPRCSATRRRSGCCARRSSSCRWRRCPLMQFIVPDDQQQRAREYDPSKATLVIGVVVAAGLHSVAAHLRRPLGSGRNTHVALQTFVSKPPPDAIRRASASLRSQPRAARDARASGLPSSDLRQLVVGHQEAAAFLGRSTRRGGLA